MNPEIKAKWLEALRSGNYKQGTGRLRKADNSYCCLGVLCDVIDPTKWMNTEDTYHCYGYRIDDPQFHVYSALSDNQLKEIGLPSYDMWELIRRNDRSSSFTDVIKYIEEHL